jgi:hypothetical protein
MTFETRRPDCRADARLSEPASLSQISPEHFDRLLSVNVKRMMIGRR